MHFNLSKYIKYIKCNFKHLLICQFTFSKCQKVENLSKYQYVLLIDYKIAERNIELFTYWLFRALMLWSKSYNVYIKNGAIAHTKYQYFTKYEKIEEQSFYFGLVQAYLLKNTIFEV